MRIIKFRAWDYVIDRMVSWGELRLVLDSLIGDTHYELMQFTGLFDKNDCEIYEGDILECNFSEGPRGVVEFDNGGFWIIWPSGARTIPMQPYRKIIGNIYENPELNPKQSKD